MNNELIKSSISKILSLNFEGCKIYKNKVEQGIKMPCFFITQIDLSQDKVGNERWNKRYFINIRYHSSDPTRSELDNIGEKLMELLDEIEIEGSINFGKEIRYEIVDNVLQFFVVYSIRTRKIEDELPKMNNLMTNGGMK